MSFFNGASTGKKITLVSIAAAVGTLAAAAAAIEHYRFWPWRYDFDRAAAVAYLARISQLEDKAISLRIAASRCQEDPDCTQNTHAELLRDLKFYRESIEVYEIEFNDVID